MKEVGLGVIGVGFMGEGHVSFLRQLPNAKVIAVADKDEGRAREVAEKYGVKKYFVEYEKLLDCNDIDAVVIATPEDAHRDPAIAAAEKGKHIFIEKPIANNLNDAKEIVKRCKKSGVKLMVGYVYRFYPQMRAVKDFVKEGLLGKPLTGSIRIDGDYAEASRIKGRTTVELYVGVHAIDLLLWYFKDNVIRVFSEYAVGEVMQQFGVYDSVCMLLKFNNGAVGHIQCGWGAPTNWAGWRKPVSWSAYYGNITPHNIQLVGTHGIVEVTLPPEGVFAADSESVGVKLPSLVAPLAYKEELAYFLNCILMDQEPSPSGEEGIKSLEIALAANESCRLMKPIDLPYDA
jgi:UDP-N-acetylglucosamine 3-dehydrogenase